MASVHELLEEGAGVDRAASRLERVGQVGDVPVVSFL